MAKAGISLTYSNGGPESITDIVCLSSSPRLGGTVILTPFYNLTAFDGGWNNLEEVIGISSLTALETFKIGSPNLYTLEGGQTAYTDLNTVGFNISELPRSLKTFEAYGSNKTTGDISSLPSGITVYRNKGSNTTTGNLSTLPSDIRYYENEGLNTVYNYYNGAKLGFGQKVWTQPWWWVLNPRLSSGVPGMSPYHLATLIIDLSSATWAVPPGGIPFKAFTASGTGNPWLNIWDYSYGPQLSAAIDHLRRPVGEGGQGVSVVVKLTAFLDPDAEAYKALISS